jgi:hypothetical protein
MLPRSPRDGHARSANRCGGSAGTAAPASSRARGRETHPRTQTTTRSYRLLHRRCSAEITPYIKRDLATSLEPAPQPALRSQLGVQHVAARAATTTTAAARTQPRS